MSRRLALASHGFALALALAGCSAALVGPDSAAHDSRRDAGGRDVPAAPDAAGARDAARPQDAPAERDASGERDGAGARDGGLADAASAPDAATAWEKWRPLLASPTTIDVPQSGIDHQSLSPSADYILRLPKNAKVTGNIRIRGGRHVAIIGGEVDPAPSSPRSGGGFFNVYASDWTGTLHLEGLLLHHTLWSGSGTGFDSHGTPVGDVLRIATAAKTARLQVVNCQLDAWAGEYSGFHNDGIQTWTGPMTVLLDGVVITALYQGLLFQPRDVGGYAAGDYDFYNVHVKADRRTINGHEYGTAYAVAGQDFTRRDAANCWVEEINASQRGPDRLWAWGWSVFTKWPGWSYGKPPAPVLLGRPAPGRGYPRPSGF